MKARAQPGGPAFPLLGKEEGAAPKSPQLPTLGCPTQGETPVTPTPALTLANLQVSPSTPHPQPAVASSGLRLYSLLPGWVMGAVQSQGHILLGLRGPEWVRSWVWNPGTGAVITSGGRQPAITRSIWGWGGGHSVSVSRRRRGTLRRVTRLAENRGESLEVARSLVAEPWPQFPADREVTRQAPRQRGVMRSPSAGVGREGGAEVAAQPGAAAPAAKGTN